MEREKVQWKVEGMDCNTCAINIHKFLEKQGMKNVRVNYATGDVIFDKEQSVQEANLSKGIHDLGYRIIDETVAHDHHGHDHGHSLFGSQLRRFLVCLPFTLVLLLHMIPGVHIHWLMNPYVQLALTTPVYLIGMSFFGISAWKSIRNGMPNMNVLIAVGATAAFAYSLYGTLSGQAAQYMFYETAATIITLVFFGNYLEEASIASTQKQLNALAKTQKVMANMIAFDGDHKEQIFPIENTLLKPGDLVLIKDGEQVPADCRILWGEVNVNESLLTGESLPVHKIAKDPLIGGSILLNGTAKAQVTAAGVDTILSGILNLVKQAQGERPPVQKLADRISAIFIPVVLGIAALTLVINWAMLHDFTPALMRSIAVLVIACPCAMGLATPAAIAVGLGRAARHGILFRNASSLESFKDIKQVVFDKTGTLTTGRFTIVQFKSTLDEDEFKQVLFSIEKYSNHPIAKTIADTWKTNKPIHWKKVNEIKGVGMEVIDMEGNTWLAGSHKILTDTNLEDTHQVYLTKNGSFKGWVDLEDETRPEAKPVIDYLKSRNIRTILLSGDRKDKCEVLASKLGIETVIAEQSPSQKLAKLDELNASVPTAMIGDGINDAPALAKATIGISMNDASQIAMQTAQVVLMNQGLKRLPTALGLGKHTYITIKQNLFWAFAYNIVAIPVAALGFLSPAFGALVMGLSDVVLAINSARLAFKKVE